jgi:hypothetical protein
MNASRPLDDRKETHVLELQRLLSNKIPSFSQYKPKERLLLCYNLEYISVGPGRVIIKEGHAAQKFYIILSGKPFDNSLGQVEVTQQLDPKIILRMVSSYPLNT